MDTNIQGKQPLLQDQTPKRESLTRDDNMQLCNMNVVLRIKLFDTRMLTEDKRGDNYSTK
jgi:hypothetical protein